MNTGRLDEAAKFFGLKRLQYPTGTNLLRLYERDGKCLALVRGVFDGGLYLLDAVVDLHGGKTREVYGTNKVCYDGSDEYAAIADWLEFHKGDAKLAPPLEASDGQI